MPVKEGEDWPEIIEEPIEIESEATSKDESFETKEEIKPDLTKNVESQGNTKDEQAVNVEWSIDNDTNEDSSDEEGQMKIF